MIHVMRSAVPFFLEASVEPNKLLLKSSAASLQSMTLHQTTCARYSSLAIVEGISTFISLIKTFSSFNFAVSPVWRCKG